MKLQLKQLREAAGWEDREAFSKAMGFSTRRVQSWENNERNPTFDDACAIADFLGCSLDELAGRWEYVGRFADKRQQEINDLYGRLEDGERDMALGVVQGVAAASMRKKAGEPRPEDGARSA